MSKQKYRELIDQLAEQFSQSTREATDDVCYLDVDDVFFTLKHGGETDEDGLRIYADGGTLPVELGTLILQRLMETNFMMFARNTPRFGFNSITKHVLATQRLALSETSVDDLASELGSIAGQVRLWRQDFFLTPEEIGRGKA
jgi:hypothetical protein